MIQRCENENHDEYDNYGGDGVTIDPEWRTSFASFVRDMGKRPAGMTIDRIDPFGSYTPENCKWGNPKEQAANRRKNRLPTQVDNAS